MKTKTKHRIKASFIVFALSICAGGFIGCKGSDNGGPIMPVMSAPSAPPTVSTPPAPTVQPPPVAIQPPPTVTPPTETPTPPVVTQPPPEPAPPTQVPVPAPFPAPTPEPPPKFALILPPGDGNISQAIGPSETLTLNFTNAIDERSVQSDSQLDIANVKIKTNDGANEFEDITHTVSGKQLQIRATNGFLPKKDYVIQIIRGNNPPQDTFGQQLSEDYFISFKTLNTAPAPGAGEKSLLVSVFYKPYDQPVKFIAHFGKESKTYSDRKVLDPLLSRRVKSGLYAGLERDVGFINFPFQAGQRYFFAAQTCFDDGGNLDTCSDLTEEVFYDVAE